MAGHSTHRLRGRRQQPTIDHKTNLLEGRLGRFGQHSHTQKVAKAIFFASLDSELAGSSTPRARFCRYPPNVGGLKPDHIAKATIVRFGSCHRSAITTIRQPPDLTSHKISSSPVSTSNRVVAISRQGTWNTTNSVDARWTLLQPRTLSTIPFPSRSRQF
jgi:hypothetical protein